MEGRVRISSVLDVFAEIVIFCWNWARRDDGRSGGRRGLRLSFSSGVIVRQCRGRREDLVDRWLTLMCRMHVCMSLGGGEAGRVESMFIDLRGLRVVVSWVA